MNIADWMDGGDPHDAVRSAQQGDWLKSWCGSARRRVLDLGCGDGRMVVPLAVAGHDVVGMDCNAGALDICRERLGDADASLLHANVEDAWPELGASFDAVLCLGNTFMLLHDLETAATVLARCCAGLVPGGIVVLDDIPGEFLPEVESGNWSDGLSEDGSLQMIWSSDEAIFTIRSGDAVDADDWSFRNDDVLLRLWTESTLAQVADAAGLSGPERVESGPGAGAVLIMRSVQAP